ncbi:MAG TPA: glycosyltransferase [Bacteroidales bacterium]|nr:glycosyltransferase [Bacteroidales bacterium]
MKKVLVISYYWPPSGGSGVQRWLKFVRYLRDFQWEAVVCIPEDPEYPVYDHSLLKDIPQNITILKVPIREPFGLYKRLTGRRKGDRMGAGFISEKKTGKRLQAVSLWIRGNFFIPDARKFWINPSARYLTKYLKENPVDIIVTTGPPMSVHMIGLKLKKSVGLPWLADFRDPWTQVDFYRELRLMKWADRKHHRMEKAVLSTADRVTVVSRGMAEDLRLIVDRPYPVITNGYDEEDFETSDAAPDPFFSIAHFGSLSRRANPILLWQVLGELIRERSDLAGELKIKMTGQVDHSVMESIRREGLEPFLQRIPYLEHDRMVRQMQRSQLLLLLINPDPGARLIVTGKLFEYLAARRPVLLIGPEEGDAAEIIRELPNGYLCRYDDRENMKTQLLQLFDFYSGDGLPERKSLPEKYSRRYLTGLMAEQFNGLCAEKDNKAHLNLPG